MKRPIFKHVDSQIENYLPKNKKNFQKKRKQEKKKNTPRDKGRHTCRIDVGQKQFSVFQVLDLCVGHAWWLLLATPIAKKHYYELGFCTFV